MTLRLFGWAALLRAAALACAITAGATPLAAAAEGEPRLALVIGEAGYRTGLLSTSANDAGLIAQALAQAGFVVTGYADLPRDALQRAFADLVADAKRAGPDAVVFIYLSGYGLQFDGSNFFVPVDARLRRDTDVPAEAVSLATLTQSLEALPLKARIVVADLAHANAFAGVGSPLASGLALVEPQTGSLMATNTAPGAVASPDRGSYGLFATALSEAMQLRGVPAEAMMARVRSLVTNMTNGGAIPWTGGSLDRAFALFPAEPSIAAHANATEQPSVSLSSSEAYWQAISRDTLQSYLAFLKAYPRDPLAPRIFALVATRREALTWLQASRVNTPAAYWTYMRRYPRGPHFPDARRRVAAISAALEPPPRFDPYVFADVPPPRAEERDVLDRPFVMFDDAADPPVPALTLVSTSKAVSQDRLPPLLPVDAGTLPLPFPPPLGFAHSTGPIIQPGLAGRAGTVIAIDSRDRDGNPVVTQNRMDQTILSVATLVVGPNGKRTVTQTGPNQKTVFSIQETTGPHGAGTVAQMVNAQVLSVTKTVTDGSGNAVATVLGPNDQPVSVTITAPDGRVARPKDAGVSRFAPQPGLGRPTLFEAAGVVPKAATPESGSTGARAEASVGATPAGPQSIEPTGPAHAITPPMVATAPGAGAPALVDPPPPKAITAPVVPEMKALPVPTVQDPVVPFATPAQPKRVPTPDQPRAAPPRNVVAPDDPKPPAAPAVTPKSATETDKAGPRSAPDKVVPSTPPAAITPKSEPATEPLPPRRPAKAIPVPPKSKSGARVRKAAPAPKAGLGARKGQSKR